MRPAEELVTRLFPLYQIDENTNVVRMSDYIGYDEFIPSSAYFADDEFTEEEEMLLDGFLGGDLEVMDDCTDLEDMVDTISIYYLSNGTEGNTSA